MSRPRILYILSSLAANDLGDEIVTILGRLSRSEFEPRVIALGGKEELLGRLVEMKVRCYPLGLSGALGAYRAVGKTRSLLKKIEPEVVHGYGSWGGAIAQLAAGPRVSVVRSVTQPPNHEKDLRGRVLQYLERRARKRPDTRFIVPNEGSRGLAVRAYGAKDEHVTVLPRSVDVGDVRDRVARTERAEARSLMGISPGDTAVALVSAFESGARMDQILTGFALAAKEEPGLRLFIVGSGRYEGSTRWKAEELQLGDSVVFLGRGTESGPIWSAADAAIDGSPWASWSRAALIALAAGVPTMKRQDGVGGWSEELDESLPMISGVPERFAAELVRLARDPSVREAVRGQGAHVVDTVDSARVVEQLGALYGGLAK